MSACAWRGLYLVLAATSVVGMDHALASVSPGFDIGLRFKPTKSNNLLLQLLPALLALTGTHDSLNVCCPGALIRFLLWPVISVTANLCMLAALKQRLGVDINGLLRMANHADGAEIAPSRGRRARHAIRDM